MVHVVGGECRREGDEAGRMGSWRVQVVGRSWIVRGRRRGGAAAGAGAHGWGRRVRGRLRAWRWVRVREREPTIGRLGWRQG
jgi:hypothetical protein